MWIKKRVTFHISSFGVMEVFSVIVCKLFKVKLQNDDEKFLNK